MESVPESIDTKCYLSIFLHNAKKLPQFETTTIADLLRGVRFDQVTSIRVECTDEIYRQKLDELGEAVIRAFLKNTAARDYTFNSDNIKFLVNMLDFEGVSDDDLLLSGHRCVLLLLLAKVIYLILFHFQCSVQFEQASSCIVRTRIQRDADVCETRRVRSWIRNGREYSKLV